MAWRQLFGEGKHGEDDQEHGYSAQEEAAPPVKEETTQGFLKATENRAATISCINNEINRGKLIAKYYDN